MLLLLMTAGVVVACPGEIPDPARFISKPDNSSGGQGGLEAKGGEDGQGGSTTTGNMTGGNGGESAMGGGEQTAAAPCTQTPSVSVDGMAATATADFGNVPAHSEQLSIELSIRNHCEDKLLFLGHPDDWLQGTGFSIGTLPPVSIASGEQSSLTLRYQPGDQGSATGSISLPHNQPGSPLALALEATVGAPRILVMVGDGGHRMTTLDYGASFALDTYTTLEPHGDSLQRGVCAGGGRFVSVGGNVDRRWWTSDDGITWTAHTQSGSPLGACAYGNGWFVSFDNGGATRSSDGLTWAAPAGPYISNHLRTITFAGDRFVASGDNGRIAVTLDGSQWDIDQVVGGGAITGLGRITAGNGTIVAAGEAGWVATSSDGGQTWSTQQVGTSTHVGTIFNSDRFFVGGGGSVYSSTDGLVWQLVNATGTTPLAAFGRYLFGMDGDDVMRSEDDGFTWTTMYTSAGGLGIGHAAMEAP